MTEKPAWVKEDVIETTLCYASRARYNTLGYSFPSEYIVAKTKVQVEIRHLTPKSNVKVTRVCRDCGKEDQITYQKARHSPLCHRCACNLESFSRNVGLATQQARKSKGERVSARRMYLLQVGALPPGYQIHHINMEDKDNRLENFIPLNASQHQISHGTFNRLCKPLMDMGLVEFDYETLSYKLTDKAEGLE